MKLKHEIIFLFLILVSQSIVAQKPVKQFTPNSFSEAKYGKFAVNKNIPIQIRAQALLALAYYPELIDQDIEFILKKAKTPLTSRPTFRSLFKSKDNRIYRITISTESVEWLQPILFNNLPFNAQVGVLGHEIAHITEYKSKNFWQLLRIGIGMLSKKFTNSFEFNTDKRCIEHGLAYQLKDWSIYTREALKIGEWKGAN